MDLVRELFQYHAWATLGLIKCCMSLPAETLHEIVPGTDRPILHTLTHIIGTEQWYLESLTGAVVANPIHQGEVVPLAELPERCQAQAQQWQDLLGRLAQLDMTLPAHDSRPAAPHGQNLLVLQAIQHGIDHRTQICTALRTLGYEPPDIDGWSYWAAANPPDRSE